MSIKTKAEVFAEAYAQLQAIPKDDATGAFMQARLKQANAEEELDAQIQKQHDILIFVTWIAVIGLCLSGYLMFKG